MGALRQNQTFRWQMNTDGPETYEKYIVPVWMADLVPDLLAAGDVDPGKRVLDAACGTGIVARNVANRVKPGGRIAALDANEGMLRVARRCATEAGAEGIEWFSGDITRMPFSDGEFDSVLCQQALQFFPDKAGALREMKRALVPGGRLALSVWGRAEMSPHVPVICEVFTKYFGEESTTIFRVACSLCNKELLHALVQDAGFSLIRIREGITIARHPCLAELLPAYFAGFPVAARIDALPEERRNQLFRDIMAGLEDYTENGTLAVPTEHIVLTAENG
ncbi:MAG: methyltransferase domain-containing protein [Methanomicrobiales archaeon]|nr:methyltransferase domain-containing protein [Methanomicrobiales archaeon]